MSLYSHCFDIPFEVITHSDDPSAAHISLIREAIIERVARLTDDELMEAVSWFDTYEIGEEHE